MHRLRTLKRQRERYVGPWLPEPLVTSPDVAEDVELADEIAAATDVLLSDGGSKVSAALRPILGPDKVARFLDAVRPDDADLVIEWSTVKGGPAALVYVDEKLDVVATLRTDGGLVRELYLVRNPDKLATVLQERQLTR